MTVPPDARLRAVLNGGTYYPPEDRYNMPGFGECFPAFQAYRHGESSRELKNCKI